MICEHCQRNEPDTMVACKGDFQVAYWCNACVAREDPGWPDDVVTAPMGEGWMWDTRVDAFTREPTPETVTRAFINLYQEDESDCPHCGSSWHDDAHCHVRWGGGPFSKEPKT